MSSETQDSSAKAEQVWTEAVKNNRQVGRWTATAIGAVGAAAFTGGTVTFGVDSGLPVWRIGLASLAALIGGLAVLWIIWQASAIQLQEIMSPWIVRKAFRAEMDQNPFYYYGTNGRTFDEFWTNWERWNRAQGDLDRQLVRARRDLRRRKVGIVAAEGPVEKHVAEVCMASMEVVVGDLEDGREVFRRKSEDCKERAATIRGAGALDLVRVEFRRRMRRTLLGACLVPLCGIAFAASVLPWGTSQPQANALLVSRDPRVAEAWRTAGVDAERCGDGAALEVIVVGGAGSVADPWRLRTRSKDRPGCPALILEATRDEVSLFEAP